MAGNSVNETRRYVNVIHLPRQEASLEHWKVAPDIRDRLEELRLILGITQAELGQRAGVWPPQANNWMTSKQRPTKRRLADWAKREGWDLEIFQEGGRRPKELVNRPDNTEKRNQAGKVAAAAVVQPQVRQGATVEEVLSAANFDPATAEPDRVLRAAGFWFGDLTTNDRDAAKAHEWLRHVFEAGKRAAKKGRRSG